MNSKGGSLQKEDRELLDELQQAAFQYFIDLANPQNGLVPDSTWKDAPASIAAVGFGLAALITGVERGLLRREEAVERVLVTLRFFDGSHQGPEPDATGYHGFYYHFLDTRSGQRTWNCELSTIDTTILIAGILVCGVYFDRDAPGEREIRQLAGRLYRRVDWRWAQDGRPAVRHGWKPESGFLKYRWRGYDEALLLYILGLGAPEHPLTPDSFPAFTATYRWEQHYGIDYLHAGPLFIHHFSHVWIDFRGIQDAFMRERGIDYHENSRRATYAHQSHAIDNPSGFEGYGEYAWGITASEGPAQGRMSKKIDGRRFYGYLARGVPGPDDGTLSPWTAITSLPFAPEIALPTIRHYQEAYPQLQGKYGLKCSLNPGFPKGADGKPGWFSNFHYGINEGPIVLMIENFRSGFVWQLMKRSPSVVEGLRKAGFRGGWLDQE